MPDKIFPDTGLKKSYARKNQEHLGIGHLPFSAHEKSYTSNRTGAPSRRRQSFANSSVSYRVTPQNLNTGQGIREKNSLGVMNAAQAKSYGAGLKSYGKGFRKAVRGQVKSEKIIDKGTKRLSNIQGRFSPKLKKAYGAYISAFMNAGSVGLKQLAKLKKKADKVGARYDKKMTRVSTRVGNRAYKKKLKSFAKAGKGFAGFGKEYGLPAAHNAKGQPTLANPVYASYKEFDKSSKKVSELKANKQSNIAGNYVANLNRARNLSLDKVKTFAQQNNAFSIRALNKAQNNANTTYQRQKNPTYGTFKM